MKFSTVTFTHYQYLYYVCHLVHHILPNIASTSSFVITAEQSSTPYHQ